MSARPIEVSWWACLFVVLGFSMMMVGGLYPTSFGHQIESSLQLAIIEIVSTPTVTLGVQTFEFGLPTYGPTAPEPTTATLTLIGMLAFGGKTNVAGGQVALMVGSVTLQTYPSDGQGYYGYKVNPATGSSVVVKTDGLYVDNVRKLAVTYGTGSTITFKAQIGSATSNTVTVTTKISNPPPMGTVTLEGCDHTKWSNLASYPTVTTCSPIYFGIVITQSQSLVTGIIVSYGIEGSSSTTNLALTKGSVPAGSTLASSADTYYGTLTLAPGRYTVHWIANWNDAGTSKTAIILSIIAGFGYTLPTETRWWWGAGLFIIGLVLAGSGFYMILPRRKGGP